MAPRTLQRNAADAQQVRFAARKVQDTEARFRAALAAVLGTQDGRRVFAELLRRAGLDRTIYDHSGSTMYFNEGRRNYGLELKATIVETSEELYELMEREERARQRSTDREADAVQTPSATQAADTEET